MKSIHITILSIKFKSKTKLITKNNDLEDVESSLNFVHQYSTKNKQIHLKRTEQNIKV